MSNKFCPGPKGEKGDTGPQGIQGVQGPPGADGQTPDITVVREERCVVKGWANINPDGTVAAQCGGVTALRTTTGRYTLTPPTGAESVQLLTVEPYNTRDSIEIHPEDFIGTTVHISEGDNGTAANIPRDRAFMAVWFGREQIVTDVTV